MEDIAEDISEIFWLHGVDDPMLVVIE